MSTFTYASLFAGIGGFDLGFDRAGMTCVYQVEKERARRRVLAEHFPNVTRGERIEDVSGTELGRPDLVVAGFPCTDISRAKAKRKGLSGDESRLYWDFHRLVEEHLRLVDETRPRFTVLENVSDLRTSNRGRDLAVVALALEHLGYGWAYRVVDSRGVGSAQRRRRIIIVGHRGGDPRPAWEVLADAGAGAGDRGLRGEPAERKLTLVPPGVAEGVRVFRKRANPRGTAANGHYASYEDAEFYNVLTNNDAGPSAVRQKHLVLYPDGRMRGLTPVEWERLQGFPDGWTAPAATPRSDAARYTALGDAMNVDLAYWLAKRILAVDTAVPMLTTPLTTGVPTQDALFA